MEESLVMVNNEDNIVLLLRNNDLIVIPWKFDNLKKLACSAG